MSATLSWPKVMTTLVKREFQEHRLLFLYSPLGLTALWFVFAVASVARALQMDTIPGTAFATVWGRMPLDRFLEYGAESRGYYLADQLFMLLMWMMAAFWMTMVYYFLVTLHQQRKNRSILFWNALPVSDTQTVASKVIAGLLCCHAVFLACYVVIAASLVLALLAFGALAGIDAWAAFIAPAHPSRLMEYLIHLPHTILWSLPVYAWLLLVSGWARQAPFVWAVGPLLVGVYVESFFTDESWIQRQVWGHAFPLVREVLLATFDNLHYAWWELVLSTVLGLALLYAAIRLNRSEDS